jgi:hypothetical protein
VDDNTLEGSDTLLGTIDTPQSVDRFGTYSHQVALPVPVTVNALLQGDYDFTRAFTLVGDKISQVNDQAAAMGNATQTVDANRPIVAPGALNGRQAGLFNRPTGSWVDLATGLEAPSHNMVCMAALRLDHDSAGSSDPVGKLFTEAGLAGTFGHFGVGAINSATDVLWVGSSTNGNVHASSVIPFSSAFLFELHITDATVEWYINGTLYATSTTLGGGSLDPSSSVGLANMDQIGGQDTVAAHQLGGYLGRLALWSVPHGGASVVPLTAAELAEARRTMMLQFGIEAAATYNENSKAVRGNVVLDEMYITRNAATGPTGPEIQEYMDKGYAFLAESNKMVFRERLDVEPQMFLKL